MLILFFIDKKWNEIKTAFFQQSLYFGTSTTPNRSDIAFSFYTGADWNIYSWSSEPTFNVTAEYDFTSDRDDELALVRGDCILFSESTLCLIRPIRVIKDTKSIVTCKLYPKWQLITEPLPPNFSFEQPKYTFFNPTCQPWWWRIVPRSLNADVHMIHGSTVTYSSQSRKESFENPASSIWSIATISAWRVACWCWFWV